MHVESQRGQTMPFWVIGVLITLSALFFLSNYANAVLWQFRAQTTADSAASGILSVQANTYNEYNVMFYAVTVDEYRLRAINQAMLDLLYGAGGCDMSGMKCNADYVELQSEYSAALQAYTDGIHLLDQANNFSQAGQTTDQSKALSLLQNGGWCASPSDYACQFKITSLATNASSGALSGGGYNAIDLIACKKIGYWGSALLNLGNAGSYKLVGRAAAAIVPASTEAFKPGSATNPSTGSVYQPTEYWSDDRADSAYAVDFSGLNVNLNWYIAGAIHPFATNASGNFSCS
ncbi:MAG: hypothetical protein ABR508_00060 [Candidatus Baltobacteraceae bacterium]